MFDATTNWTLPELALFLVIANFAGSIALMLGVGLVRDFMHKPAPLHIHLRTRLTGALMLLMGVVGWVFPWLIIWNWYRVH